MSESCPICFSLLSSHKRRRQHTLIQCSHTINRYALNINGTVGSLYDCWIDNIIHDSPLDKNFITEEEINELAVCDITNVDNLDGDDLLQILDIEDELWLSIALEMAQVTNEMSMLYNYQIPNDRSVCFLYYHRIDRKVHVLDDVDVIKNILSTMLGNTKATHIITNIKQGIDFIIVLESPINNKNFTEIQPILNKVCKYFTKHDSDFLSSQEQEKLNHLTPTIFSRITEICSLQNTKSFSEMCQHIHQYLFKQKLNIPLFYTLHSVKTPGSDDSFDGGTFIPLDSSIVKKIRKIILKLFNKLKTIEHRFDEIPSSLLSKHLQSRYNCAFDILKQTKNMYVDVRSSLAQIVFKLRQGTGDPSSFGKELNNLQHEALDSKMETLLDTLLELRNKARFIAELETNYGLGYFNVADLEEEDDDQRTLETKVLSFHYQQLTSFLCSSDELKNKDITQHEKLCQQLMNEQKTNSALQLLFADFSYCKFRLPQMKIVLINLEPTIPSVVTRTFSIEPKQINILLLGETGVGKSTFINALVNYLAFESIEKAEKNGPIVLIPVSFQMTSNDQFDEYKIELDKSNSSNEDFDHPGQTITQHCQSYLFNLGNNTKLRIIDTPGIGDTRGLSQDDKNIQYILSYVNHLSHLNAVCILLKPNISRLHVLFRSCLEQIFNFLGPNVRDNIIFCFTSSRSTFFCPGNTAPLLKKMLNELPADHTPQLGKANMFCFDSESFQYLAAIKSQVDMQYKDDQKADFITCWNKSVSESIRFINLIKSCPYYQMNTWHSIKHAQIIITSLIRPILETIRNILRNQVLSNEENKQYSIEIQAQSISRPSYLCTICPFQTIHINIFPAVDHSVHQYRKIDECDQCQCEYNKHFSILYKLTYNLCPMENDTFDSQTKYMLDSLLQGSVRFAHFLLHMARIDEDPFLPWLDLFIREELYLCSQEPANNLNTKLHMQLVELKDEYQKQLHEIKHDQEYTNIDEIYQWIEKIEKFQIINEQMSCIKKSQMEMMQYHEHDVSSQYPDNDMSILFTHSIIENE